MKSIHSHTPKSSIFSSLLPARRWRSSSSSSVHYSVEIPLRGEESDHPGDVDHRPILRFIPTQGERRGQLAIVLAGHPKLRNDLRKPTMKEINHRATVFSLDGIAGSQREYIHWLLQSCGDNVDPEAILTAEAIDLLASRLRTPLQIEQHLTLALEAGYQTGEQPVSVEIVESVLSKQLDDLEPTLTRHGYRLRDLSELVGAKPDEIKALFRNQLEPSRSRELREQMLAAGLPI